MWGSKALAPHGDGLQDDLLIVARTEAKRYRKRARALRKAYLVTVLLTLSSLIVPVNLQSSLIVQVNSSSRGIVCELGVWDVVSGHRIPPLANWVVARYPSYDKETLLENPGFELGTVGWYLYTPSGQAPLGVDIIDGWKGKCAVMVSDGFGYRGGLGQAFYNVPPNTTFHFKAMVKTVNIESLEAHVLFWDIYSGGRWLNGKREVITKSHDWVLYEVSFTTPFNVSDVGVFPALLYNRGQVWIDEVSVEMEPRPSRPSFVILNWCTLHPPWDPFNPFRTAADLKMVEDGLKIVPAENFWGIIFIEEEHYRVHVDFNDDVNTTWFGERLLGYPSYLQEVPTATKEQWRDEMFLRMIRGFCNYFHAKGVKVGVTANGDSTVVGWKGGQGIPYYFGEPAMAFIRQYYDFVVLYAYTENLDFHQNLTKQYFTLIDQLFQNQKKFWILTRIWNYNKNTWEREAIALEMKNCLDRNIAVLPYHRTIPTLNETWALMLKSIELQGSKAPYFETRIYGTNLLTGYVGNTYGWVKV